MKFNKLISVLMSLTLISAVNAVPVYAQPDSELFKLYSEYFEDKTTVELKDYIVNEYDAVYNITHKSMDNGRIIVITDYKLELNTEELADYIGYSDNLFSISESFYKPYRHDTLYIGLYSDNHETNKDIFTKIYNALKEKYVIDTAYVRLDSVPVSVNHSIKWDSFIKKDEFGYEVSSDEYLSKSKINSIRNAIESNNFPATIDDDGKIIFDESVSEIEKFRFALWFKKEYGFYVSNYLSFYYTQYNTTEVIHYTDLIGDVNNDNYVNDMDAEALQEYLLSGNTDCGENQYCFNWKNADLTGDGVIDVFDLVKIRQVLINGGNI